MYEDQSEVSKMGINNYYCIANKSDYYVMGDFYKYNFTYLEIRFNLCVNSSKSNTTCYDQDTINTWIDSKTFSVAFVNTFFDFNDYEKQVKYFIDDTLFFELDHTNTKYANLFV
jgi:hypothetical protein